MPKTSYNIDHRCQCYTTFFSIIYDIVNIVPWYFDGGYANIGVNYVQKRLLTLTTSVNVIQLFYMTLTTCVNIIKQFQYN